MLFFYDLGVGWFVVAGRFGKSEDPEKSDHSEVPPGAVPVPRGPEPRYPPDDDTSLAWLHTSHGFELG